MHNFTKKLGATFAFVFVLTAVSAVNAAPATGRTNRAAQSSARMPTMPVLPINAAGNMSLDDDDVSKTDNKPDPQPNDKCADGGVRNSEYTVTNCMDDILTCVNNGALPGGLNDLFNEETRNSIMNGMGLCGIQVEKCITTVRQDCKTVYHSVSDVWIDFNSRKVQPEYYNFVLRKTGLTPNQAENTCRLLDKNTYGSSFAAVANDGKTTAEYNKQVGAYNGQQGNVLIKNNPQGAKVNDGNPGVDGGRGHYARWDASTGTCYVRVAAYNKDEQIKNSWLFGALGDDRLAEVWRAAGDTFSCNKDLFGFSLMNNTSTAAVVGVGGGALVGAGIGAIAGHKDRVFDCNNNSALKELNQELAKKSANITVLNYYLSEENKITSTIINKAQCQEIVDLYIAYNTIQNDNACFGKGAFGCNKHWIEPLDVTTCPVASDDEFADYVSDVCTGLPSGEDCAAALRADLQGCVDNISCVKTVVGCHYKSLRNGNSYGNTLKCDPVTHDCATEIQTQAELAELAPIFNGLTILAGEESNMGRSIATGAAIGAGTGGVATAITAFVERSNITCHVGDGLNTVAFGKSHSIDSLKDFYVKWNLRLPDTVSPTSTVVDCDSWKSACAQFVDLNQCKSVALNYRPGTSVATTLVRSACIASDNACIENATVAKSYGACK